MEAWIAADPGSLRTHYGEGFRASDLPRRNDLEAVSKAEIYGALQRATRNTRKGAYAKGRHSFAAFGIIQANVVASKMPHCARFLAALRGFEEHSA